MRAIKAVLRVASQVRAKNPDDDDEASLLKSAFEKNFSPSLIGSDRDMFDALLSDLFAPRNTKAIGVGGGGGGGKGGNDKGGGYGTGNLASLVRAESRRGIGVGGVGGNGGSNGGSSGGGSGGGGGGSPSSPRGKSMERSGGRSGSPSPRGGVGVVGVVGGGGGSPAQSVRRRRSGRRVNVTANTFTPVPVFKTLENAGLQPTVGILRKSQEIREMSRSWYNVMLVGEYMSGKSTALLALVKNQADNIVAHRTFLEKKRAAMERFEEEKRDFCHIQCRYRCRFIWPSEVFTMRNNSHRDLRPDT
jgi:hypothetical protein